MDDKEKAKVYLQYGENIIDVEDLPAGIVVEAVSRHIERPPTFEERFVLSDEDTAMIEFNINIKVRGKIKDVGYLHDMKKCAIVPYPED